MDKYIAQPPQAQGGTPGRRPGKEEIREWMRSRLGKREPLPAPEQLRRLLGWSGDTPPLET